MLAGNRCVFFPPALGVLAVLKVAQPSLVNILSLSYSICMEPNISVIKSDQ